MARVFIAEPSERYDLKPAEEYGEITFLSTHGFNPFDTEFVIEKITAALETAEYNPKEDFICLTGQSLLISMFLGVVAALYDDPIRILLFDARKSVYRERSFNPA